MDYSDQLELINGPEDGVSFPLVRTPVDAGRGEACAVQVRFDPAVCDRAVRITAVSEGYRIRRIDRGRAWANGKRIGRLHSRILRHGETLRLGNSDFHLSLAPEGLAQRSHGLAMESDLVWALRRLARRSARGLGWTWRMVRGAPGPLLWPLLFLFLLGLAAAWLMPGLLTWLWFKLWYWLVWLRYLIWRWVG